jgi:hypothetical protein
LRYFWVFLITVQLTIKWVTHIIKWNPKTFVYISGRFHIQLVCLVGKLSSMQICDLLDLSRNVVINLSSLRPGFRPKSRELVGDTHELSRIRVFDQLSTDYLESKSIHTTTRWTNGRSPYHDMLWWLCEVADLLYMDFRQTYKWNVETTRRTKVLGFYLVIFVT